MVCFLFVSSCKKEKFGSVEIKFTHTVDNNPAHFNQLTYTNSAENQYEIGEIKYFISRLTLIDAAGKSVKIIQDDGIHYVDICIERMLHWKIKEIPQRNYTAVSFVFGLDENDNKSNCFVNPPESNFSWPEVLGGGYHYMQINGKFLSKNSEIQNMNIHTGIGQLNDNNNNITQFVHNYFTVTLPVKFSVDEDSTTHLTLNMEIQRWFDTPNIYDFEELGSGIMQNQHAQQLLKENGWNVFEIVVSD
jgi:hypothetical protein